MVFLFRSNVTLIMDFFLLALMNEMRRSIAYMKKVFFLHWLTAAIPRQLTEVFVCALGWHTIFLIV